MSGTVYVSGALAGAVNVHSGTLNPSLLPGVAGTLSTNSGFSIDPGANINFALGKTTGSSQVQITGGTFYPPNSGTATINIQNSGDIGAGTYTLFSWTNPATVTANSFTLGTSVPGFQYSFSVTNQTLQVTLTPIPVAFGAWQSTNFSAQQLSDPTLSGPSAAPENDGVPNLLKYFYDIDPTAPMSATDRAALPTLGSDAITNPGTEYLTLAYRENQFMTGITVTAQTSTDLKTWYTDTNPSDQPLPTGTYDNNTGDPYMQVQVPVTGTMQFIRLNVTQP